MAGQPQEQTGIFNLKTLGILVLLMGIVGYGLSIYLPYSRGLKQPPADPMTMNPEDRPPSPAQMKAMFEQTAKEIGLSEEQQKQVQQVLMNRDLSREERRAELEKITTPEQQQKFMQGRMAMMQKRMERAKKKLSGEGQKALDQRIQNRMRRGGPGGPPRP